MEKSRVIFAVLFATAVLVLLAFFLLLFFVRYRARSNQYIREREKLKKEFEQTLLQSKVEVQENTFAVLSGELHDNIGQLLVSAKAHIAVTQLNLKDPPNTLQVAEETLQHAINEIRYISKLLNKDWLQQFDFIENMQTEINRINALKTLQLNWTHPEQLLLPPEEQLILFRIVQEALQNSVKHADGARIDIEVSHSVSSLIVSITDDGKGFEENTHKNAGLGLKNMSHRTQLLGGTIEWISSAGKGSKVILKLPAKKSEQ